MVNIIGHRYLNLFLSGIMFLVAVVALLVFGLKGGIDFNGGSLLEISFTENTPVISEVQKIANTLGWGELSVQSSGDKGIMLKTKFLTEEEHQQILKVLRDSFEKDNNKVLENRFETIGPSISSQLRARSAYAVAAVIIAIVLYIAYSFRRVTKPVASWKFGVVAVVALFHDTVITAGVFAFLGHFAGVEVGVSFVVALLAILGYSVNDTIVVFDRIRENLIRQGSDNFAETVNKAINETFARSINTTATTLFTLAALFFFGGETIKYFALALLIGIFLGAYSSIFVASPLLVEWFNWNKRRSGI